MDRWVDYLGNMISKEEALSIKMDLLNFYSSIMSFSNYIEVLEKNESVEEFINCSLEKRSLYSLPGLWE